MTKTQTPLVFFKPCELSKLCDKSYLKAKVFLNPSLQLKKGTY